VTGSLALEGPHWSFVIALYRGDGVSEACLVLQDQCDVDVSVLLFSLFAACEHRVAVDRNMVVALDGAVRQWRTEIVAPLRALRRRLKQGPAPAPNEVTEPVRNQVKTTELRAEQIELAMLYEAFTSAAFARPSGTPDLGGIVALVVSYFAGASGAVNSAQVRQSVALITQAAGLLHSR
jgi:uncharacterized protein (TIGR02444 family)